MGGFWVETSFIVSYDSSRLHRYSVLGQLLAKFKFWLQLFVKPETSFENPRSTTAVTTPVSALAVLKAQEYLP